MKTIPLAFQNKLTITFTLSTIDLAFFDLFKEQSSCKLYEHMIFKFIHFKARCVLHKLVYANYLSEQVDIPTN